MRDPRVGQAAAVLAVLTVGVWVLGRFLVLPWVIEGPSMAPSLEPGDRVLVDRWTYRHRAPRPGEVALILGPRDLPMVKRVAEGSVGDGFHVLGDNPGASIDSREFGPVSPERFRGRVVLRYWPPGRAGALPGAPGGEARR